MALGDVFMVRCQYGYLAQRMENRYFYLQTEGSGGAALLGSLVEDDLMPSILSIQSISVVYSFIVTVNLDDSGDFDTISFGSVGIRVGDRMPPYVAWGFKLISSDRIMRAGGKRFGGVSEDDVLNGVAEVAMDAALTGVSTTIAADLVSGPVTNRFTPVLHRLAIEEPPTPAVTVLIDSAPYLRVTTQSSRKFA